MKALKPTFLALKNRGKIMNKVILIRFSEIHLKGRNKSYFLRLLYDNIKHAVKDYKCVVEKIQNRVLIKGFDDVDTDELCAEIKKVFGVYSMSLAYEMATDYEEIKNFIKSIKVEGSFKIDTNRADKSFFKTSYEVDCDLGEIVLNNNENAKVDVKNPKTTINVDIRENGRTYIFYETIYAYGGMPLGEYRDGLLLLSGGIDSPVAGFQMAKRGLRQDILHFDSYPYTSPLAREKVIKLAKEIKTYIGCRYMYIISMTKIQEEFHLHCKDDYAITLLRRAMVKIAEKICNDKQYKTIVTGESLGQVASQTIESLTVTNNASKIIPIMRPLISFNKDEIIKVAQEIGTYETSILPYEDCCTVFLPRNPIIKPKLSVAEKEEKNIPLDEYIKDAIENMIVVEL